MFVDNTLKKSLMLDKTFVKYNILTKQFYIYVKQI